MKKILLLALLFALTVPVLARNPKAVKGLEHVVLIGSDGFSADVIRNHPGVFVNIEALMKSGSSTLEKRSVLPSSSAVNWASMLMGAGPELHGFTDWGSQKPELESRVIDPRYGLFPSIFSLVRAQRPTAVTAAGYTWGGIGYLYEQKAVDYNTAAADDKALAENMCQTIEQHKPLLTFIAFAEPDGAGHGQGWESDAYFEKCKEIDGYVGQIVEAIRKAGIERNTIVIFTSDHGGIGTGHGGKTMHEMQTPLVIAGKGIQTGHTITSSVMQFDVAAILADLLGVEQPQVWIGRPVSEIYGK